MRSRPPSVPITPMLESFALNSRAPSRGGTTRALLEEVNRRAPANASIWFHKSAWGAYVMYQREGWFRRDLRYTTEATVPSALGFYHHQKDHDDYELDLWQTYHWRTPVAQWSLDGVPMLTVYEAPPPPK